MGIGPHLPKQPFGYFVGDLRNDGVRFEVHGQNAVWGDNQPVNCPMQAVCSQLCGNGNLNQGIWCKNVGQMFAL